jgi:secreted Zn-dependent insulinase-like peptidase
MVSITRDPRSKFGEFSIGNNVTLGTKITEDGTTLSKELKEFFRKYYSANLMSIAI